MTFDQIILDLYCDCKHKKDRPRYCTGSLGFHCLADPENYAETCKFLGISQARDEFAHSNGDAMVDYCEQIPFLPSNENIEKTEWRINTWKEICQRKIDEAYEEYQKKCPKDN